MSKTNKRVEPFHFDIRNRLVVVNNLGAIDIRAKAWENTQLRMTMSVNTAKDLRDQLAVLLLEEFGV